MREAINYITDAVADKPSQEEKEAFFEERTADHIGLVQKAIDMIVNRNPEWKAFDENALVARGEAHDQSKYSEPERGPYIELTWRKKEGNDETTPEINAATLHHIINNSHHPEASNPAEANLSAECRDESDHPIDAGKMLNLDISEMVADWQAMSWELGTNTAREWYDKQKNVRWIFTSEQDKLINELLSVFEEEPAEETGERLMAKEAHKFATADALNEWYLENYQEQHEVLDKVAKVTHRSAYDYVKDIWSKNHARRD